ncbi:hypothetical protein ACEXQE_20995 [Herbiconiux sp. P17]|uniref:hypothetical protein n=1 Tax=Herbiconiux wuyangfengii TaxID=3342794 RepID=UPI0035BAF156
MTSLFLRNSNRPGRGPRPRGVILTLCAGAAVFALTALTALAPPPPTEEVQAAAESTARQATGYAQPDQTVAVPGSAVAAGISRDGYAAAPGLETYTSGSTNRDWAELVLYLAGFPVSESNVTVMMRWMRQENGPDDWWLRNNPLNNGWGSGGGSGLGSYDNLVTAAQNVGNALHGNSGYSAIVAGFASSAPTAQIEAAIWASPWASSHYANGSHWAYTPVPEYASPAGTWG